MGRIYTDSLVHDKDALEFLVKIIGESQVMLGTDYPFPLGELDCGNLIQSMETFDGDLKVDTHSFYFIIFIYLFYECLSKIASSICTVIKKGLPSLRNTYKEAYGISSDKKFSPPNTLRS